MSDLTDKEKDFLRDCIWTLTDDLTETFDGQPEMTLKEIRDLFAK